MAVASLGRCVSGQIVSGHDIQLCSDKVSCPWEDAGTPRIASSTIYLVKEIVSIGQPHRMKIGSESQVFCRPHRAGQPQIVHVLPREEIHKPVEFMIGGV